MKWEPVDEPLSQTFIRREYALVQVCQQNVGKLRTGGAQQHLRAGFERRLLLNQTSRLHIENVTKDRKTVLNTYACSELNVHLNSYYVQLRGALDNLAWILHYESDLLGKGDESDPEVRRKCNLFDGRFLQPLEAVYPALAKFLREKQQWFGAFKELRDPIAHRVPLFAMPGVIREGSAEAARQMELNQDIDRAVASKDLDLMRERLFESFRVGTYEPWFAQYGPIGYAVRDIRAQIESDHKEFLDVAEAVFSFVLV
jgi:hypothetical protein